MGIGTSLGAYYDDSFHQSAAQWNPDKYDDNMVVTPNQLQQNKQMDQIENDQLGGIQISDKYDTPLNSLEQENYNKKFSPQDSADYDMQGWYKANPDADPKAGGVHYPDTFKKPSHPTFSDESQYSNPETPGGHWQQLDDKNWSFAPSDHNLKDGGLDRIKDYLQNSDPNVKLILPQNASSMASKASGLATDALKRSIDTKPTTDVDTGIDGKVYYQGKYGSITDKDIDTGLEVALGASGGGLKTEKITSAAVEHKGSIYEGLNHAEAFSKIPDLDAKSLKEGFTTSHGRFVSREEAMDIAKKSEQIHPDIANEPSNTMLLSEDLSH